MPNVNTSHNRGDFFWAKLTEEKKPKACRQNFDNNRTVKRLTEEEMKDPNESSEELDENIHHIKETKKIEETNKQYTTTVKINGKRYEFITDTGFLIPIMPLDKEIVKLTEIQKVTNRY